MLYVHSIVERKLTADTSVLAFDPADTLYANRADVLFRDGPTLVSLNGAAPDPDTARVFGDGDQLDLQSPAEIQQFRATRSGATNGLLYVVFFKW